MATKKAVYDFFTWTSFPSSIKLLNDEEKWWANWPTAIEKYPVIPVRPGAELRLQVKAKQENVLNTPEPSHIHVDIYDGTKWVDRHDLFLILPVGSFPWSAFGFTSAVPAGATAMRYVLMGGSSKVPGEPGVTWFDDFQVFQDGVLIHQNKFSSWTPYMVAGLGMGAVGLVFIGKRAKWF